MAEQGSYYSMENLSHTHRIDEAPLWSVGVEGVPPTPTPAALGPTNHMRCLVQDKIRLLEH